jgi:hypothetical protein
VEAPPKIFARIFIVCSVPGFRFYALNRVTEVCTMPAKGAGRVGCPSAGVANPPF